MSERKVVLAVGILVLGLGACATVPPPPLYTPYYSFTPLKQGSGKGISIALVAPTFAKSVAWSENDPLGKLRSALSRSLMEYFTANGFTVSGPFKSVDDMTFPQKKEADLLLKVEIDVTPSFPAIVPTSSGGDVVTGALFGTSVAASEVSYTGTCSLSGSVSFVLWEPLSMQRMWAKEVDISSVSRPCAGDGVTTAYATADLSNAEAHMLEEAFPQILKASETYFHPDEVQLVKQQSLQLRQKKVY